ncbi:MAG TPA: branched-chain amino acid transport system II carrier protein [Bacillota bacterium]|nr:branched-chain amino acid transport system II carrier protein [Bacillota bacterium]
MGKLSGKEIVFVSFMLFSMFFGAGNLIFPPSLGASAGEHLWYAMAGFILSAVGLPILGVMAVAQAGSFQTLSRRVHPSFAIVFPLVIYLSIGPGLAIPRAGSLAFEMGVGPFLAEGMKGNPFFLLLYTVIFFSVVYWLCLSPSKLIDRFGKLLTPLLLTLIFIIFVKSMITPLGTFGVPTGNYALFPSFQGFLDGYQTMDALAALIFGIVVANTLRVKGIEDKKRMSVYMVYAGLGAGTLLTIIYIILGFFGASSYSLGKAENGAQILTLVMSHLFGSGGAIILGLIFTLACLCVSIGLVTSCGQFFHSAFPRISYKSWALLLCVVSMIIANLGLTQILKISVPVLGLIYPVAIVMIILALVDRFVGRYSSIYTVTVGFVGLFSLLDMVNKTFLANQWDSTFLHFPLYAEGVGWLVPAVVGVVAGFMISVVKPTKVDLY